MRLTILVSPTKPKNLVDELMRLCKTDEWMAWEATLLIVTVFLNRDILGLISPA